MNCIDYVLKAKEKMSSISECLQAAAAAVKLPFEDNQWNFDGKQW